MADNQKKKGSRLFIIAFIVFLSLVILLVADMASRTTAPWNKVKKVENPSGDLLPDSLFESDSL